jgi:DNA polymerase-3 subunit delta
MAVAHPVVSYESLMRDIAHKQFKPVYLLMGEENYYIDRIAEAIINNALTEEERGFNLITYYGLDAELGSVINSAKSYPMGAEHTVVFLREAQYLKNLDDLTYYFQNLQLSTILLITYKNGTVDRRKKLVSLIESQGALFVSERPKESELPRLVSGYVSKHGFMIDQKSAQIISDSVGSDISRLYGELDKLMTAMPASNKNITPQIVQDQIGISKDFNYFELQNALITKNVFKANQIANYFDKNQKQNPLQVLLPMLSRFFASLMVAYYSPDRSERGIANYLGMADWQVRRNIFPAFQNYSAVKVLHILDEIRATDEKLKGLAGTKIPTGDLLKQLIYFILH